jgi:predicted Zn-dependent peptidase
MLATSILLTTLAQAAEPPTIPFEQYDLPNGLHVVLAVDPALPEVVVNTWYKVGSKDEVAGRSGFAHLFEHLMFMGTFRLPGSGIDDTMEARGGWNNAFTYEDATNYYDVGPTGLLPALLWIEADRLEQLGKAMSTEKLELQRDVVRNERRQTEDEPYGSVEFVQPGAMFSPEHPYGHTVIGTHEDLMAASLEDVQQFFATWYVPNNACLVVAGDFDPATVKQDIARYFGHIPMRALPDRPAPPPVATIVKPTTTIEDRVDADQLNLFFHAPAAFATGDAEMSLLATLLADGESSRLYRKLVATGLAQDVGAVQNSLQYGSVFRISVTAMPDGDMDEIESIVRDELDALAATPPTAAEMEWLHNQAAYRNLTNLESLQNKALQLAIYWAYTGDPGYLAKDLARYENATADGLRDAARAWLGAGAQARILVVPRASASAGDTP